MRSLLFFLATMVSFSIAAQQSISIISYSDSHFDGISLEDISITDEYTSGGVTHVYFQQAIDGVQIYDSRGAIHVASSGGVYATNRLIPHLQSYNVSAQRELDEVAAIEALAEMKAYDKTDDVALVTSGRVSTYHSASMSNSELLVTPLYYVSGKEELRPGYEIVMEQKADGFWYSYIVDAASGDIFKTIPLTLECNFGESAPHKHSATCIHGHKAAEKPSISIMDDSTYNVYVWPVESPNFGDRSLVAKPWLDNTDASPQGWHNIGGTTYSVTRGNNVDAYIDDDNSNNPTNGDDDRADGGADMLFDFDLDVSNPPGQYKEAAVTNLFYWNNVIHDMLQAYGFDEQSGNFQEVNYGPDGSASDYVRAEAQDGGGTCNANMSTPPDGSNSRMQMYLCGNRDGDFDNGVIAHEYGHGLSIRLTGGPGTSGCLNNTEQMGEGWSDYLGMIMTIEPGDEGTDSRGMGTWLFGEGPEGDGIRPYPYSTDLAINPMTYGTIDDGGISVPHGVGSVWCTMVWEMTWALIEQYGFDPDIYYGNGGNNIAFRLVVEGLKLQPCSPGFVDGRDAILAADELLYDGANQCIIWEAFAKRGLGFSASQGSSSSRTDGQEAFDMPSSCRVSLEKTASVSEALPGSQVTYKLKSENFTGSDVTDVLISDDLPQYTSFVSATNGGYLEGDSVKWPLSTLAAGSKDSVYFTVVLDGSIPLASDIDDDLESGLDNYELSASGSTAWETTATNTNSGNVAFFAPDNNTTGLANIVLAMEISISDSTELSFYHYYDTENNYDGGVLEISTNGGLSWTDIGDLITVGGYNSVVSGGRDGWSGDSNGWIQTVVDLGSYSGSTALIRWQMICDFSIGGDGWYVDDISITNLETFIPNTAYLTSPTFDAEGVLAIPTRILEGPVSFSAIAGKTDISCNGLTDGIATVNPVGGTGVYTYTWSTGATTQQIGDLGVGTYTVTVSDGVDEVVEQVTIDEPAVLDADAIALSVTSPGLSNGQLFADIEGGTEPYSYSWSNGSTAPSQSNMSGGEYSLTVSDANNCEDNDDEIVADPTVCTYELYQLTFVFGQSAGDISFVVSDQLGTDVASAEGPYQGVGQGSTITRWFCLPPGCYDLSIIDDGGDGMCSGGGSYTFSLLTTGEVLSTGCSIGSGLEFPFCASDNSYRVEADITEVSCNDTDDGAITATASNGSGNYLYRWEDGTIGQTITNLTAGSYTITVTDLVSNASLVESFEVLDSKYSMVTTAEDNVSGSLRAILTENCDMDTILFDESLIDIPIILDGTEIEISQQKIINGLGADLITIDADGSSRVFRVTPSGTLDIRDITIRGGAANPNGGNIYNQGALIMERVALEDGQQNGVGRSLTNEGTLTIREEVDLED